MNAGLAGTHQMLAKRENSMLTRVQIREVACATLETHGMLLVRELKKGDNFDGGNLVALLELSEMQKYSNTK